ncbi:hypothetical protein JQ612_03860 [Bradyrhizobium manausense]|uniref:hypothetical protein n=1 Tax=Bradyrhizobium manausense TaxID=989370 RepID=UPI001BAC1E99|nr:hypothetical protein [Bradyrhizobium manausense]MBR0832317.1 hypothetical protein [Bradyrhizobium manausense]
MRLQAIAHKTIVSPSGVPRPVRQGGSLGGDVARTAVATTFILTLLVGFAHGGSRDDIELGFTAVEAERIGQSQAIEQERDRAERLARELASVRAELNAVRIEREHAIGAIELGIRQTHALELERDKVNNLTRDLSFLRAELDAARIAASKAMQVFPAEPKQEPTAAPGNDAERAAAEVAALRSDLDIARSAATDATNALGAEVAQKEVLKSELKQQRDNFAALVTEQTSLKVELEAARTATTDASKTAAAEATRNEALKQELKLQRDKADAASTELDALRTAANTTRTEAPDAAKASSEAKLALENALAQQRDRADSAVNRLASVQAEFDAARRAHLKASSAEAEQRQTLERELGVQRDRANALAGETTSLAKQRDDARSTAEQATRAVDAAEARNKEELVRERNRGEALLRELASARKEVEERSAGLAAAYAEILRVTELNATAAKQSDELASERQRADGLARELALTRARIEQANRKPAAIDSPATRSPEQTSQQRERSSDGKGGPRSREQDTARTVTPNSQPRSQSGSSILQAQPTTPVPSADPGTKDAPASERSASASATPLALGDEQRLLARANALLRQVDISSARQLLELALAHGSAQAAFMLAETYDPPVLESWHARGVAGDRDKARDLYQRAKAGGIDDAEERIKTLK